MMTIVFSMNHRHHKAPIELCGRFDSLGHFARFQQVEAFRGWYLVGLIEILKGGG